MKRIDTLGASKIEVGAGWVDSTDMPSVYLMLVDRHGESFDVHLSASQRLDLIAALAQVKIEEGNET